MCQGGVAGGVIIGPRPSYGPEGGDKVELIEPEKLEFQRLVEKSSEGKPELQGLEKKRKDNEENADLEKEEEPRRRRRARRPRCLLVLVAALGGEAEVQSGETLHPGYKSVQIFLGHILV